MVVYGTRERPRVLAVGVNPSSEFAKHLEKLVPTLKFIADPATLGSAVRQADYDAAILLDCTASLEPHLFVLQFGGGFAEALKMPGSGVLQVRRGADSLAATYEIPDGVSPPVARLIDRHLVGRFVTAGRAPTIDLHVQVRYPQGATFPPREQILTGFLVDPDGRPIACKFDREDASEWWCLPEEAPSPEQWTEAALTEWRALAPERFPSGLNWEVRPEWQTEAEISTGDRRGLEAPDVHPAQVEQAQGSWAAVAFRPLQRFELRDYVARMGAGRFEELGVARPP